MHRLHAIIHYLYIAKIQFQRMGKVKIVSASAGSGKTYNLAYEYVLNVVREPYLYRHILAVTFTNKATEEMKQRILDKINQLAMGTETQYITKLQKELGMDAGMIARRAATARSLILHDYGHFAVLTIDRFFQRIIRAFIKELGIDLNFNLELPVESLLGSAADRMIDDISVDDSLRGWIADFVNDRIGDGRKWDIRGDLLELGTELFKEEYKRIRGTRNYDKVQVRHAVSGAVDAAQRAVEQMVAPACRFMEIIAENGLSVTDFSFGNSGVAGYVSKIADGKIAAYGKRVTDTINKGNWCPAKSPHRQRIDSLSPILTDLLSQIVEAYDSGIRIINTAAILKENYRNFALLGDLQERVARVAKEENIVHISEINDMLSRLIEGSDTPFVFEKAGNYYSHFMIDEFQDTSVLQWNNFLPLLQNAVAQSDDTPVMLVGDVKQSIYRWRDGDWRILAEYAARTFDETVSIPLNINRRSRATVVEFINACIERCSDYENTQINTMLNDALASGSIGSDTYAQLYDTVSHAYADCRQEWLTENAGGYVTITHYDSPDRDAVPPVVELVEQLQQRGYNAGDIAILVRRNSEAVRIASLLLEHKAQHPDSPYCYDVITQDALSVGRAPVVNFVVACLRLAVNPDDMIARAQYCKFLGRGFTAELSSEDTDFFARLRVLPPDEAFELVVMRHNLADSSENIAYLQAFHEQIISFSKTNIADIPLFLNWWRDNGASKSIPMPSTGNAITIDTIHRSKGLGYKVVIIPYCNWSMVPRIGTVVWSDTNGVVGDDLESFPVKFKSSMQNSAFADDYYREYVMSHVDNLNLLYVALTRAKEELHIMIPHTERAERERISNIIDAVSESADDGKGRRIGKCNGTLTESEDGMTIHFGSPVPVEHCESLMASQLSDYHTVVSSGRIKIKFDSQRYAEDGAGDDKFSPRDYGVLMHKVFEQADNMDDIHRRLSEMSSNGVLSTVEVAELEAKLQRSFENDIVRGWFGDGWQCVRHEESIIRPGGMTSRPDRVMVRGDEVVVVDYKFGLARRPEYSRQVLEYMNLLRQMGYADVKGYIWYVNLEDVEPVALPC